MKSRAGEETPRPPAESLKALERDLERVQEDLALVLGVLAGMWPSSIVPSDGGERVRVVIDSPAGELVFEISRKAAGRMWHVPEVAERPVSQESERLHGERLVQLATGITPAGTPADSTTTLVTDRRASRTAREA